MGTRWLETNCDALCYGCHSLWEESKQGDYRDFKIRQLGEKGYLMLEAKARTVTKFSLNDLYILEGLLKQQLRK